MTEIWFVEGGPAGISLMIAGTGKNGSSPTKGKLLTPANLMGTLKQNEQFQLIQMAAQINKHGKQNMLTLT